MAWGAAGHLCVVCLWGWSCLSLRSACRFCVIVGERVPLLSHASSPGRSDSASGRVCRAWTSRSLARSSSGVPVLTPRPWTDSSAGCDLRGRREGHLCSVCFLPPPIQPGSEQPRHRPAVTEAAPVPGPASSGLGAPGVPAGSGAGPGRRSERGGGRAGGAGRPRCPQVPAPGSRTSSRELVAAPGGITRSP